VAATDNKLEQTKQRNPIPAHRSYSFLNSREDLLFGSSTKTKTFLRLLSLPTPLPKYTIFLGNTQTYTLHHQH